MQPQPTFDTHAFVKSLTGAGMHEDQAKILAKGQADLYERLVTKEYFEFTLKHELEIVRAELEITKTELKRDIKEMEHKLTIKLGALLGISVTVLAALIKFF